MLNRKGQNVAEYAILIALVVGAAVAMQTYVKRGLQGRVADAVDYAPGGAPVDGQQLNFQTRQYEPYYTQSNVNEATDRNLQEAAGARGQIDKTGITDTKRTLAGSVETTLRDQNAR